MSGSTKSMRLNTFNPKSILLTGMVLVLIIGLFFIPEIIDFQRSLSGSPDSTGMSSAPNRVVEPGAQQVSTDTSQSTGILDELMEANYLDRIKARQVLDSEPAERKREVIDPKTGGALTWQSLRSKPSAGAIKAAQATVFDIAKKLPAEKTASRFSLLSFGSGLGLLLQNGEKSMTPGEGVRYVEYLHTVVARTMLREGIESDLFNRFASLSFGPVFAMHSALEGNVTRLPLSPGLALHMVDVRAKGEKGRRWVEGGPVFVQFAGTVDGSDIKAIRVIANGSEIGRIKPKKGSTGRIFKSKRYPARGVFQLRVEDSSGQVWEKLYTFYPRVRRFDWRKGRFDIPLSGAMLDRYFTFRPGRLITMANGEPADPFEEGLERF